jgi:hypothetical protein
MRENPYQVIDLMTNETVEWTDYNGTLKYLDGGYDISYRPGRKTTKKKEFPQNG